MRTSHETGRYLNHGVAAHHSIHDVSPDRRHPFPDGPGRSRKSAGGIHFRRPAIWNAGARRKAGGIHHHLLRVRPRAGRPGCPHERDAGCYRWRHRHLKPSFPFRVDNPRVGHHRDVIRHAIGECTVEFAMAPEPPRVTCRITPVAVVRYERYPSNFLGCIFVTALSETVMRCVLPSCMQNRPAPAGLGPTAGELKADSQRAPLHAKLRPKM